MLTGEVMAVLPLLLTRLLYLSACALCAGLLIRYALRRDRMLGWMVFGGLVVYAAGGLAFGAYLREYRDREYFAPDEIGYLQEANRIIDDWKSGTPHVPVMHGGYPYWNAAVVSLWGPSLTPLRLSNALVAGASVVVAYLFALALFKERLTARFAALAVAVWPSLVIWSMGNLKERWIALSALVVSLVCAQLISTWSVRRLLVLGVAVAALGGLRHYYGALLGWLCVAGFLAFAAAPPRRRALRGAAVVLVVGTALWISTGTFMGAQTRNEGLRRYVTNDTSQSISRSTDFSLQGQDGGHAEDAGWQSSGELVRALGFVLFGRFKARHDAGEVLALALYPEWLLTFLIVPLAGAGVIRSVRNGDTGALVPAGFAVALMTILAWVHGDEWNTYRFRVIYLPIQLVFASGALAPILIAATRRWRLSRSGSFDVAASLSH